MDYNSESFASSYPNMTRSSDSLRLAFETDDFPRSLQLSLSLGQKTTLALQQQRSFLCILDATRGGR
jgi:hypothetical protein